MNEEAIKRLQLEQLKKQVLFKYLTKEAIERLGRIKTVKPELAEKVELAILQAIELNQIKSQINDEQLKNILNQIITQKKFNIRRE